MSLRKTSLVLLYIFFIFHLQYTIPFVSSRPSSLATNNENETLPSFNATKPDDVVVGFEAKSPESVVVIRKGGGGGRGGGGFGSSRGRGGGGGSSSSRSRSRGRGRRIFPVGAPHYSSGSRNLLGAGCSVGRMSLWVLGGLILVAEGPV